MTRDAIVEEIRFARQKIFEDCNEGLDALLDRFQEQEKLDQNRLVSDPISPHSHNAVQVPSNVQAESDMCKRPPRDPEVCEEVKRFSGLVHRLKYDHYTTKMLLGDRQLGHKIASTFFDDIIDVLMRYFFLEVAKLGDPATSNRGKNKNFTIARMLETIDWPPGVLSELDGLNKPLRRFQECIRPARDKILAHHDNQTYLSELTLGVFPEGDDEKVIDAMEQMCILMEEASLGGGYGTMECARHGDVTDLQKAMKEALAFRRLLEQSKGEEHQRLMQCLDDVSSGP
jgi:hypothetical protein